MRIGITTSVRLDKCHFDRIDFLIENGFSFIEIHNSSENVVPSHIPEVEPYLKKGVSFSFHSAVTSLFSNNALFRKADEYRLKAEIFFASKINVRVLVFHIKAKRKLSKKQLLQLKEIISYAKSKRVTLCLENNSHGVISESPELARIASFTGAKICMDLGHLNVSTAGNIKKQKEFLRQVFPFVKHVHLHGNGGKRDEHEVFPKNRFSLLKELPKDICLVIEVKDFKKALKQKKILEEYLNECDYL